MFLRLCEKDFLLAAAVLRMIRRHRRSDVKLALLRDGIVSYVRPFSENKGRIIRVLRLGESIVPVDRRPLHRDLVVYRNQVFAHTDVEAYSPQLGRWPSKSGFVYPMSFRGLSADRFVGRASEIVSLVEDVHHAVQLEEHRIEAEWLDGAPGTSH